MKLLTTNMAAKVSNDAITFGCILDKKSVILMSLFGRNFVVFLDVVHKNIFLESCEKLDKIYMVL